MARVITLSRQFPKGHPRAGEPTYFPEKIWKSLLEIDELELQIADYIYEVGKKLGYHYADDALYSTDQQHPKHHTVRKGKRWKTGDMASLRVWSDKPYRSKQIAIAPDVEITVKDIEIDKSGNIFIGGVGYKNMYSIRFGPEALSKNDGLTESDFFHWFTGIHPLPFSGQILCWNTKNLLY